MPYLRRTGAQQVSPETLEILGRLVGLSIPPEDIVPLTAALSDQLASIDFLGRLDLTNVDPVLKFDPRWHDRSSV